MSSEIYADNLFDHFSNAQRETIIEELEFKVLTWNLWLLPFVSTYPKFRSSLISSRLEQYEFCCCTESFDYFLELQSACSHRCIKYFKSKKNFWRLLGSGLSLFSRYRIVDEYFEHYNHSSGYDSLASKGFFRVKVQLGCNASHTIDVWNTHWNAICNGEDSSSDIVAMKQQALQLANAINRISGTEAVIVVGDFNTCPRIAASFDSIAPEGHHFQGANDYYSRSEIYDNFLRKCCLQDFISVRTAQISGSSDFVSSEEAQVRPYFIDRLMYRNGKFVEISPVKMRNMNLLFREPSGVNGQQLSDSTRTMSFS